MENSVGNTFEMYERVLSIKNALKLKTPLDVKFTRLGSAHDGGYILVDDVNGADHVISLGVEGNVDFEKDIMEKACHIYMYDNSIDGLPEPVKRSTFFKRTMGSIQNGHASLGSCIQDDWVGDDEDDDFAGFAGGDDYILKMDVEGAEYDLLGEASRDTLTYFRQITVEFHDTDRIEDEDFYKKMLHALTHLRETHTPVFVHANNNIPLTIKGNSPFPQVFEATFLRNDSYKFEEEIDLFEGLVTRNDLPKPEIGLTFP